MADIAKGAVFVRSEGLLGCEQLVRGPVQYDVGQSERSADGVATPSHMPHVVGSLGTIGFQATNFGKAAEILKNMVALRFPASAPAAPTVGGGAIVCADHAPANDPDDDRQPIVIYLGLTANLLGTGVRESILFLVKHKMVDHIVVTGGGIEHDVRRAISPHAYVVDAYTSEQRAGEAASHARQCQMEERSTWPRFGNVRYQPHEPQYTQVMQLILREVSEMQLQERERCASRPVPNAYDDVCAWASGPSDIWREVGLRLARHTSKEIAERSVVHWAARNDIPIYSPSFTDGDVMELLRGVDGASAIPLKLDLVCDIHKINKSAMAAKKTGMIILGGGVAKHHVCNANLMRNGADFSIFINNAQEFDGSDAGARPDEAISWGKIRIDAQFVKVYSEISLVFPLLVAHTVLPAVRRQLAAQNQSTSNRLSDE